MNFLEELKKIEIWENNIKKAKLEARAIKGELEVILNKIEELELRGRLEEGGMKKILFDESLMRKLEIYQYPRIIGLGLFYLNLNYDLLNLENEFVGCFDVVMEIWKSEIFDKIEGLMYKEELERIRDKVRGKDKDSGIGFFSIPHAAFFFAVQRHGGVPPKNLVN